MNGVVAPAGRTAAGGGELLGRTGGDPLCEGMGAGRPPPSQAFQISTSPRPSTPGFATPRSPRLIVHPGFPGISFLVLEQLQRHGVGGFSFHDGVADRTQLWTKIFYSFPPRVRARPLHLHLRTLENKNSLSVWPASFRCGMVLVGPPRIRRAAG